MIRSFAACAAALLAMSASAQAAEDNARTTRIETQPVNGARVTVENGVRVFRPLPSEQHVIVNPGGSADIRLYDFDGPLRDRR
ncbi:MAG TPA: hypothetical protein VEA77_05650 [Hyphomicrobium sp.]|nr:hypothetical protein [Hyphomicrobium sp.]